MISVIKVISPPPPRPAPPPLPRLQTHDWDLTWADPQARSSLGRITGARSEAKHTRLHFGPPPFAFGARALCRPWPPFAKQQASYAALPHLAAGPPRTAAAGPGGV
jgi:hypothetical protein